MNDYLLYSAIILLISLAVGLVRLLRGPGSADRVMAAQLFGTGGIALFLILGVLMDFRAATDVALTLAFLASFLSIAFARTALNHRGGAPR